MFVVMLVTSSQALRSFLSYKIDCSSLNLIILQNLQITFLYTRNQIHSQLSDILLKKFGDTEQLRNPIFRCDPAKSICSLLIIKFNNFVEMSDIIN